MIQFRLTDIEATIENFSKEEKNITEMAREARNECSSLKNSLSDTIKRVQNDIKACQSEESQAKNVRAENEALKNRLLSQKEDIKQQIASNNTEIARLNAEKSASESDKEDEGGESGRGSNSQVSQIQSQIKQLQSENSRLSASLQDIERKISTINDNNARLNVIIDECRKQMGALKHHLENLTAEREHLISTHDTLSFECKQLDMVLNNVIKTANQKLECANQFVDCFDWSGRFNEVTVSSVSELSNSLRHTIMVIHQIEKENRKLVSNKDEALKLFTANAMRDNAKNIERAVHDSNECLGLLRSLADKLGKAIEFLKYYEQ